MELYHISSTATPNIGSPHGLAITIIPSIGELAPESTTITQTSKLYSRVSITLLSKLTHKQKYHTKYFAFTST